MVIQFRRPRINQRVVAKANVLVQGNPSKVTTLNSPDDPQQTSTVTSGVDDVSALIEAATEQGKTSSPSRSTQDSSQTSHWTDSDPVQTEANHVIAVDDLTTCAQWPTSPASGINKVQSASHRGLVEDSKLGDEYYNKVVTARDLQTELARLRQCTAEVVIQLERMKSERKALEYELQTQEAKNNQLAEENTQCLVRLTENRFLEESIHRVKKQLDELAAQANQSREDRRRIRTECVRTELERRRLVDEYLRLETSRASNQDQLEALRRHRQELEHYQEDMLQRQQLASRWEEVAGAVHVVVRIRSTSEQFQEGAKITRRMPYESGCLTIITDEKIGIRTNRECSGLSIRGTCTDSGVRVYQFNHIFPPDASQSQVYQSVASQVKRVTEGYNATILFYGPRGSGKTYTCMGTYLEPGVASFAVADLLRLIKDRVTPDASLYASIVEIYNDRLSCVISKRPVQLKDTGSTVYVRDQKEVLINKLSDFSNLIVQFCCGGGSRGIGRASSKPRSHTIIFVKHVVKNGSELIHSGTLILGDLVTSVAAQGIDSFNSDHVCKRESWYIQRSVTKLTSVLQSLKKKNSVINCRGARLTELLKPCFAGDSYLTLFLTLTDDVSQFSSTQNVLDLGKCVMGAVLGPPMMHPQTE